MPPRTSLNRGGPPLGLRRLFDSLLGRPRGEGAVASTASALPAFQPDSPDEPAQITSPKVLLIVYSPTMDPSTGRRMPAYMGWPRPDDLVGRFISELLQTSGGLARYR